MEITKKKVNIIHSVLAEKCPNCGEGNVYRTQKSILSFPEMNARCSDCNYRFDREPGYFIGAMYISYALAVFQGLVIFLSAHFLFPSLTINWKLALVIFVIVIFAKKNYKWSRILYIHLFPW